MKIKTLYRDFQIRSEDIDEESRSINISFSSETKVERVFGTEVLDHTRTSVDLTRLRDGAPFLVGHDKKDLVGVVDKANINTTEKKGEAVVRFGKSARAEEIFQDVKDGIRKHISVGYVIERLKETIEDGKTIFRAMRWMPFEISLEPIPADIKVGVGRDLETEYDVEVEKEENDTTDGKARSDNQEINIVETLEEKETRRDKLNEEITELKGGIQESEDKSNLTLIQKRLRILGK